MGSKTMRNLMGGSIEETMYKGALGPPGKPIKEGLLPTCFRPSRQRKYAACVCRTLEPSLSRKIAMPMTSSKACYLKMKRYDNRLRITISLPGPHPIRPCKVLIGNEGHIA